MANQNEGCSCGHNHEEGLVQRSSWRHGHGEHSHGGCCGHHGHSGCITKARLAFLK